MVVQSNRGAKLTGFFRGQIVKHLLFGKCKIWIPGIYPEEYKTTPDKLPDAEQAAPLFAGSNFGNGIFSYPNINAIVWCFFANEDQNHPVYFASTLGHSMSEQKYQQAAPELDEKTGEKYPYIHIIQSGKSKIQINEGGQIVIETNGDKGKNKISVNQDGSMEIINDSMLQIKSDMQTFTAKNFQVTADNISLIALDRFYVDSNTTTMQSNGVTQVTTQNSPTGKAL